ncbi:alpha/beta hydrolase [Halochromatium salexigens]|uniref:alpha/beta hydrolase n=1 Tax=Halochromatium salexigens TaxID=49447 RepID=UPI001913798B|nr:alpha/beta hydrolase [Halochromatium salexigens]
MSRRIGVWICTGLLLLAGCSRPPWVPGGLELAPQSGLDAGSGAGMDGGRPEHGVLPSTTGCPLAYRLYRPEAAARSAREPTLVVLGHGFLRSQARMRGLAEAIAAAGLAVATLDLCNMRPWAGRHQQNGLDMIALARHLQAEVGGGERIYVGFSAGGLAALVAARHDQRALGVVTLDLVDTQGIGQRAARQLEQPLLGLAGSPTDCNAQGNAEALFAERKQARLLRIPQAGHCDFEAPTDVLCEWLCADPAPGTAREKRRLRAWVMRQAVAAITALAAGRAAEWPLESAQSGSPSFWAFESD